MGQIPRHINRRVIGPDVSNGLNLEGGIVNWDIYGEGVTFTGPVNLEEAVVLGEVKLQGARIQGPAHFRSGIFKGEVLLKGTVFEADAWLEHAKFHGGIDLEGAVFGSIADFSGMRAFQYARLRRVKFKSSPYFNEAVFDGDVDFTGMRSEELVSMRDAYFRGTATFTGAQLHKALHLDRIKAPLRLIMGTPAEPLIVHDTFYLNGAFVNSLEGRVFAQEVHMDGALIKSFRGVILTKTLSIEGAYIGGFRGLVVAREVVGKPEHVTPEMGRALAKAPERYQTEVLDRPQPPQHGRTAIGYIVLNLGNPQVLQGSGN
ncbi:pentapeptide repeat-containing protein [Candidatus Woesearchaeota archaeon]|nr:pentapeptide repeat-containing protein [Candidatus Woesearchaeota archaeon]